MEFDPNNPAHQRRQDQPDYYDYTPETEHPTLGDRFPPQYSAFLGRYLTQEEIHAQMVKAHNERQERAKTNLDPSTRKATEPPKPQPDLEIAQVAEPITKPLLKSPGSAGQGFGKSNPSLTELEQQTKKAKQQTEQLKQGVENGIDQLNPFKSDAEKKALRNLTDKQKDGFKKSQHHEDLQKATDSFRNDRGCTFVDLNTVEGNPVRSMMTDAMTGSTSPTLVIDPSGQAAEFDGRYKGNAKGKQRLKNKLFEVEALSPQNAAQESAAHAFIRSKLVEWEYQGTIAHRCGCELRIMLPDADLVQFANQNVKLSPGIRIQEAKLGGIYSEVRYNTVGGEFHHMPSSFAIDEFINPSKGWGVWMRTADHLKTKSHGRKGDEGRLYRARQKMLIQSGKYRDVMEEDIDNVMSIENGLYGLPVRQMLKTLNKRGVR